MNNLKQFWRIAVSLLALVWAHGISAAQEGLGPFMPNEGGSITTAWADAFGPDAESWIRFSKVGPDTFDIDYSSSRGTVAVRRIRASDRMTARALVLCQDALRHREYNNARDVRCRYRGIAHDGPGKFGTHL